MPICGPIFVVHPYSLYNLWCHKKILQLSFVGCTQFANKLGIIALAGPKAGYSTTEKKVKTFYFYQFRDVSSNDSSDVYNKL